MPITLSVQKVYGFAVGDGGRGFYIPLYQRPLTWDKKNVDRLFESIHDGFQEILNSEGSVDNSSFIGTVVCYHDIQHTTIEQTYRGEHLPDMVYVLIDGQQRVTIMSMIAVVLHEYLKNLTGQINMESELGNYLQASMAKLRKMIEITKELQENRYLPRIIRSGADRWAISEKEWIYRSPASRLLHLYGNSFRANPKPKAKLLSKIEKELGEEYPNDLPQYNFLRKTLTGIKSNVKNVCKHEKMLIEDIAGQGYQKVLKSFNFSSDIFQQNDAIQSEAFRALVLSKYFMERIEFVVIVTTDEDHALDIFDSLNTTGEQLTAYETFRGTAIKREGLENYEDSPPGRNLANVDIFLNLEEDAKKRAVKTHDLLISFVLAENGIKLPKKLSRQRLHLNNVYKDQNDNAKKERFTKHLMHVSEVYRYLWEDVKDENRVQDVLGIDGEDVKKEFAEAQFCLNFIKAANHTISIALISRFYDAFKIASEDDKREKALHLCKTIKAVAACFAVWRISRTGTDGIDGRYIKLMNGLIKKKNGGFFPAFKRDVKGDADISSEDVQKILCYLLREDGGNSDRTINTFGDWKRYALKTPIYQGGTAIAKFIILLASDGAVPDEQGYLTGEARGNVSDFIGAGVWSHKSYKTLDHIIPQSDKDYDGDAEHLHRIGNLTLLPKTPNSIIQEHKWAEGKREIYQMLSADSTEEFDRIAQTISHIKTDGFKKLRNGERLLMTKAVSYCPKFDEEADIEKRGENLLDRAWVILADWLEFEKNKTPGE